MRTRQEILQGIKLKQRIGRAGDADILYAILEVLLDFRDMLAPTMTIDASKIDKIDTRELDDSGRKITGRGSNVQSEAPQEEFRNGHESQEDWWR